MKVEGRLYSTDKARPEYGAYRRNMNEQIQLSSMNSDRHSSFQSVSPVGRRILIVLRRMGMGGIEQASKTLAQAFVSEGHEVHMMVLKGKATYAPIPSVKLHHFDLEKIQRRTLLGITWYLVSRLLLRPLLPGSGFVWQGIGCSQEFKKVVIEIEKEHGCFDLILIRGQGAFEMLWNVRDRRVWRVVESAASGLRGWWGQWLLHRLYHDHQIICVSQGVEAQLLSDLNQGKTHIADCKVIYNAVSLEYITEQARVVCFPNFDQPYLVHVGRLVPVKQQQLLLEAYQLARRKGLMLPLVIIGDGSERGSLESLASELEISEHVHFLGQQKNPYPWVAGASAFVLSSRTEGLGLVLIEALALKTQCVATDVPGGIREVLVDEQRRLLAEHSVESLAEKILEAINFPVNIENAWLDKFSESNIVREYISLIK